MTGTIADGFLFVFFMSFMFVMSYSVPVFSVFLFQEVKSPSASDKASKVLKALSMSFQKQCLDNSNTSLRTVFIGTISYQRKEASEIVKFRYIKLNQSERLCFFVIWVNRTFI